MPLQCQPQLYIVSLSTVNSRLIRTGRHPAVCRLHVMHHHFMVAFSGHMMWLAGWVQPWPGAAAHSLAPGPRARLAPQAPPCQSLKGILVPHSHSSWTLQASADLPGRVPPPRTPAPPPTYTHTPIHALTHQRLAWRCSELHPSTMTTTARPCVQTRLSLRRQPGWGAGACGALQRLGVWSSKTDLTACLLALRVLHIAGAGT